MDDQTGFDAKRRLCPDGTCTGIVDRDGKCSECGRMVGGGGSDRMTVPLVMVPQVEDRGSASTLDDGGDGTPPAATAPPGGDYSGFDPQRRLCVDGACVGVIGSNGACTVCGRMAG
jgi:hypothetical protein